MRILAVDDEPSIVRLVSVTLSGKGHTVTTASNGEEALAKVVTDRPDLIVLDVMMPRMDGWEVSRRLSQDEATKGIPIIFLTAVGQFDRQLDALEAGAYEYLTKPFTPSDLVKLVDEMADIKGREKLERDRKVKTAKLRRIDNIMRRDKY